MPAHRMSESLAALSRVPLLDPAQLEELHRRAGSIFDPATLARELIDSDVISAFQANLILDDRGDELLLGSYVLVEKLGEGGMGTVFAARNWKLGHRVAIKLIRQERLNSPDAVRRFYREIRAAAQLDHPNVVRAYDADEIRGSHFFVMEFVDGVDLAQLIRERGPLAPVMACDYIRQAALGLQHAHERGMVHRDIKPDNLLLANDNSPLSRHSGTGGRGEGEGPPRIIKVADLGLARQDERFANDNSGTLTQVGMLMGTPDFMAPEQSVSSHTVDIRADLYSLGCTLYFLLTGSVPFPGGSLTEKLMQHQVDQPKPIEMLRPQVPTAVTNVVYKLMSKNPAERFQSPGELAAMLQSMLQDPSVWQMPSAHQSNELWAEIVAQKSKPKIAFRTTLGQLITAAVGLAAAITFVALWWQPWRYNDKPNSHANSTQDKRTKLAFKRIAETGVLVKRFAVIKMDDLEAVASLRMDLRDLMARHYGTQSAGQAWDLLSKLPSPLDQLNAANIPAYEAAAASRAASGSLPKRLVAILGDSRLRHWDIVRKVAFSPDGKRLASCSIDGTAVLWDPRAGQQLLTLNGNAGPVGSVAFSQDGKRLATGHWDTLKIWDANTGAELFNLKGYAAAGVAFGPDGKSLVSAGEREMKLWDAATGQEQRSWTSQQAAITFMTLSPDGKTIASASGSIVQLRDIATGLDAQPLKHASQVNAVAFSPDGRTLVAGCSDAAMKFWDVATGQERDTLRGHTAQVLAMVFSPDGKTLASASNDFTLKLWNVATGEVQRTLKGHNVQVNSLAFSPDGKTLAFGGLDCMVRLQEVDAETELLPPLAPLGPISDIAFSPDERFILTGGHDHILKLWDAATGKLLKTLEGHTREITCLAISPDGRIAASAASYDGTTRLWDLATGKELRKFAHGGVCVIAFSPDGRTLAAGARGQTKLWDIATGNEVCTISGTPRFALAFSPDGKTIALGGHYNTVALADAKTGKNLAPFDTGYSQNHVFGLAFAPDGRTLAIGQVPGAGLWDVASRSLAVPLAGHNGHVGSVVFRLDGQLIATRSTDGKVRLWDVKAGTEQESIVIGPRGGEIYGGGFPTGAVRQIALTADGRYLATANGNGTVYLLRLKR